MRSRPSPPPAQFLPAHAESCPQCGRRVLLRGSNWLVQRGIVVLRYMHASDRNGMRAPDCEQELAVEEATRLHSEGRL